MIQYTIWWIEWTSVLIYLDWNLIAVLEVASALRIMEMLTRNSWVSIMGPWCVPTRGQGTVLWRENRLNISCNSTRTWRQGVILTLGESLYQVVLSWCKTHYYISLCFTLRLTVQYCTCYGTVHRILIGLPHSSIIADWLLVRLLGK